ncbi:hypothetical protein SLOPH_1043 [Spraguea lophii 42_110]|uniref:Uncharacterized protein n=1 Tax=Spraguea lophii (strain 42_110) TaxID=1358809 RepID=S7W785_SPRLO|nr:hypothetical protein SLOPH_1043 [Spraguea lophii 42_110]
MKDVYYNRITLNEIIKYLNNKEYSLLNMKELRRSIIEYKKDKSLKVGEYDSKEVLNRPLCDNNDIDVLYDNKSYSLDDVLFIGDVSKREIEIFLNNKKYSLSNELKYEIENYSKENLKSIDDGVHLLSAYKINVSNCETVNIPERMNDKKTIVYNGVENIFNRDINTSIVNNETNVSNHLFNIPNTINNMSLNDKCEDQVSDKNTNDFLDQMLKYESDICKSVNEESTEKAYLETKKIKTSEKHLQPFDKGPYEINEGDYEKRIRALFEEGYATNLKEALVTFILESEYDNFSKGLCTIEDNENDIYEKYTTINKRNSGALTESDDNRKKHKIFEKIEFEDDTCTHNEIKQENKILKQNKNYNTQENIKKIDDNEVNEIIEEIGYLSNKTTNQKKENKYEAIDICKLNKKAFNNLTKKNTKYNNGYKFVKVIKENRRFLTFTDENVIERKNKDIKFINKEEIEEHNNTTEIKSILKDCEKTVELEIPKKIEIVRIRNYIPVDRNSLFKLN